MTTDATNRLGINLVGYAFEEIGFAFREQPTCDFGIDAHVERRRGSTGDGQLLGIQVKTGTSYFSEAANGGWWFRPKQRHVTYWREHALPVVIVLVDLETKCAYWEVVSQETLRSAGSGMKVFIPSAQRLDSGSAKALRDYATPVVPTNRYTVVREEDTSHGAAKRYSLEIVLNGAHSVAEIVAVIRAVTDKARRSRYQRSEVARERWSNHEADVVGTFVYLSVEDRSRRIWYCRSMWIRPDLDDTARPLPFPGESVGGRIVVDWRSDYSAIATHLSDHAVDKHAYLEWALPLVHTLRGALERVGQALDSARGADGLDEFLRATAADRQSIGEIAVEVTNGPLAPFECSEMDKKLEEWIALAHNMVLPFTPQDTARTDARGALASAQSYRRHAEEIRGYLDYETSKVR